MDIQVGIHGLFSSYPEPVADGVERKLGLQALDGTLVEPSIRELPLDISAYGKAFLSAIEVAVLHLHGSFIKGNIHNLSCVQRDVSRLIHHEDGFADIRGVSHEEGHGNACHLKKKVEDDPSTSPALSVSGSHIGAFRYPSPCRIRNILPV